MNQDYHFVWVWPGPVLRFGLSKPVTILVAHLLLNIKKIIKVPKIFFMQNKCYIMFLAWIALKRTIKTKSNPSYSNYISNSFLTKNFLSVNRKKKKKNNGLIKHNKINTNNKLKIIKKSLDKHGNTLHSNTKTMTCPHKPVPTNKSTWLVTIYTWEQNFQTNQ